jgi:hypothetical protein
MVANPGLRCTTPFGVGPATVRFLSIDRLLEDLGAIDLAGINWVIVGGERGWRARPMDPAWVISIRDQCQANDVLFFFKQWGGAQKSKHSRLLDGRRYDDMPQRFARTPPPRSARMALIDELAARTSALADLHCTLAAHVSR